MFSTGFLFHSVWRHLRLGSYRGPDQTQYKHASHIGQQSTFIEGGSDSLAIGLSVQVCQLGPVGMRAFMVRGVQANIKKQGVDQALEVARVVQLDTRVLRCALESGLPSAWACCR